VPELNILSISHTFTLLFASATAALANLPEVQRLTKRFLTQNATTIAVALLTRALTVVAE
jgi:hypothetical protein